MLLAKARVIVAVNSVHLVYAIFLPANSLNHMQIFKTRAGFR
ncbi:hypothetical protein HMPREF0539_2400 [Lacticaseibacillus rhamnosus LMS2-1]|uniref:Uncharacterized protein n=1 Tax=Lacticaseibacillus rhamnosus (strain LMS2-1) TaxID=525361 RepID=C2JZR5_LACRM|nr:conserved hypothetical protein [Lacticaseibacillus rhamnosus ATCC 8530]EEN79412.1 hypothetical protein HMPREF0539_2400 [Lacticaseibacillus rhamnosus LMS2-1]